MVPCESNKIKEFLLKDDAYDRIYDKIQPFCPGRKEFYLYRDVLKFSMFSEHIENMAYFIDEQRNAKPIRNHSELRAHWQNNEDRVCIYTLDEAVDAVKKLIG